MVTNIGGYDITGWLHESTGSLVLRGRRRSDGLPVVLKMSRDRNPPPSKLARLKHEYALLRSLEGEGFVQAHELIEDHGRWALVQEDFGGSSLVQLGLAGTLSLEELLTLAHRLAGIVGALHQRRVVHKDINPSNIVMNRGSGRLALIDFGISTQLSQESSAFSGPNALAGTLVYMSPEQTGRMNRPIDYRTDYYSLGATLYELFTGQPPLLSRDPLELVHWIIARQPPAPHELDARIPRAVSDILLKLLAKSADDRYQSARGLQEDLGECLEQLRRTGTVLPFPLGRHDSSELFRLPQKLYGRQPQVERLLAAFERTGSGAALMTVSGDPGIGKSALVQEVYRPLTRRRGYFAAGKFEQSVEQVPYAALGQVFQALIQQLLTESEEQLSAWRERLGAALGVHAALLAGLCPSLERVLGRLPELPALAPPEARERFQQVVRDFIAAFATPEHPLCLFLDDLQWADTDSLKLLAQLLAPDSGGPLFVVGTYRDNEVGPDHPLRRTLKELEAQGVPVENLVLSPLGQEDVTALVADTLSAPPEAAAPLAELLGARTGGNPFFVRAFLTELHAEGLLRYTSQGWRWDVERIRRKGITDNVVDLMVTRVERLPPATQGLLEVAACLGGRFELGTLEAVAEPGQAGTGEALWPALIEGLVLPLSPVHSAVELGTGGAPVELRFTHDRVRQAVLSRLAPETRARMHRDIGRKLLARGAAGADEHGLFDVVGQLNQGRTAMTDAAELDALAGLNLRAARRALQGMAPSRALEHAQESIALLREPDWERRHDFCWEVYMAALEAAFLCGDVETFERLARVLLAHARTLMDELKVLRLQGQLLFFQQRADEALDIYLDVLRRLGAPLPKTPGPEDIGRELQATAQLLGDRPIEELLGLPECTQPEARAILEFLGHAMRASSMGPLFPVAICRIVQRSLQHGNSPDSVTGYLFYGLLLVRAGDHDRAGRFGRLALRLAEHYGVKSLLSQVNHYSPGMLLCWKQPLYELVTHLVDSYRHAQEAGSPYDIANNVTGLCQIRFLAGGDLRELAADMAGYHEVVKKQRNPLVLGYYEPLHQLVLDLVQDTAEPSRLSGPVYHAQQRQPALESSNALAALFIHHHCQALLAFLLGDVAAAVASAEAAEPGFALLGGTLWAGPVVLLRSLYRLAACAEAGPEERERLLEKVAADQQLLASWVPHNPRSMEHRQVLVEAERARVLGDSLKAHESFERAVELARRSGYQHEEALTYERAARFHLAEGDSKRARHHLRYAHQAYLRWGAVAKARALEREHPHLLPRFALASLTTQTLAVTGDEQDFQLLDVLSVLNASQAISSELALDKLLVHLMQLLIETGGAELGYLLLQREGRWVAEVEKSLGQEDIQLLGSIPLEELESRGHRGLPASIIHYVARSQESVVLDDAAASERFGRDPYIVRHGVRSALCFPLSRKGGRVSLVYLENNLTRGAFTRDRLRILQLLSSQAVISLENALLYETMEAQVEQRTGELRAKNDQLASTLSRLQETQNRLILQDRLASLGSMTAGIAHELRNPLNFVNSFSRLSNELLKEILEELAELGGQLDPGRFSSLRSTVNNLEGNLSKIAEHGRRMDGIIRSMLEHSRGGSRGDAQPADLNALVSKYVQLALQGSRLRPPNLAVELSLDESIGKVSLIPQELSRAIVNIIDNACHAVNEKAKKPGAAGFTPTLQVRSRNLGNRVELGIRDNGIGIPSLIRDKIFNPFFTTKKAGEGTGLGLSISHDIVVKGHGGTLHFESEEGAFTEFIITLPHGEPQGGPA